MPKKSTAKKTVMIIPLRDRVLIRPLSEEEVRGKKASGIILPETLDKEKPEQGEVIAVGEGKYENGAVVKPLVKKGDRIVFSKYGYDEVTIDGVEYFFLREDNILGIIH
jgi:chaperonin GroES